MEKRMTNFKEDLTKVKAFVFDVDGVFSNGIFYLNPDGEPLRSMNIKDGFAVQLAVKKGYKIGIITGGTSKSIKVRFNGLGVEDVYLCCANKMIFFEDFIKKNNLNPDNILYMGDDLPDYNVMKRVGVPTCPADSAEEIKQISKYISDVKGGNGCVRDVIEQVMRAQGKWMDSEAFEW